MMRYAIVENNVVVNVVLADARRDQSWVESDVAGPGWIFDPASGELSEPEPPKPTPVEPANHVTCSPAQGLVALFAIKQITEADVGAAIASIPDPVLRYTTQIAFARATEWRRDSVSMQQLATMLRLTDAELDELFAFAVTVNV